MNFNSKMLLLKIAVFILAIALIICVIAFSNNKTKADFQSEDEITAEIPLPEARTRIEYRSVAIPYEEVYVEQEYIIETVEVESHAENRYSQLNITDADIELMAQLIYHEARGESFTGQRMVAEVVLNRVLSSKFPNNIRDVIYQHHTMPDGSTMWQFSPAPILASTTANSQQYDAVRAAILETPITDANVLYFSVGAYNNDVFARIGGHVFCRG